MKNILKRVISMCTLISMLLFVTVSGYADNSGVVSFVDENGESYTIVQNETSESVTTTLYNEEGDITETLILDKSTGILMNPKNGATLNTGIRKERYASCVVNDDKSARFCEPGDSYYDDYNITVGKITDMISGAISIASIIAIILGMGGVPSLLGTGASRLNSLAKEVFKIFNIGISDHTVEFAFKYVCTEMYHNDPDHPDGGVSFYGYEISRSYFSYVI